MMSMCTAPNRAESLTFSTFELASLLQAAGALRAKACPFCTWPQAATAFTLAAPGEVLPVLQETVKSVMPGSGFNPCSETTFCVHHP